MATTKQTTTGRSAEELLGWSREMVDPVLRVAVDTLPEPIRLIAGYHFGWWDERGNPAVGARGKAVRPALVLLTAQAVGGAPGAAVHAAAAVELVHAFSLLHDDVMDGDVTRRHRPTAWSVFGIGAAILAGDSLLTLAFDVLASTDRPFTREAVHRLSAAVQALVAGQSADMAFENRADVDVPECLRMVEGKTGALLGCACALGAEFGGGRPEQVELLREFGERLGVAFQLIDDLLGIWGDPDLTGKPVYSDLRHRKMSMPVVAALTSDTAAGRALAEIYDREPPLPDADLVRAAELIDAAGGRDWCRSTAVEHLTLGLRHLWSADPDERTAAELTAIADLITRRDH